MNTDEKKPFWDRSWESISPERMSAYVTGFDMSKDAIISFLLKRHVKKICDAGCGCGIYSLKLLQYDFSVSGFDIVEDAVSLTKALLLENGYPSETFKKASVLSTGYADRCFDAVVARDLIDHIPIRQGMEAVNELLRIVRPRGCVLLTLDMSDGEYESEPHETNDDGDYLFHRGKWDGMVFHPYSIHGIDKLANGNTYKILPSDDPGFIVVLEARE